ncbi:hypothetical protein QBC33DRAFT_575004 [Phialemonium atrogriseum]|uniref:Uncharacterized protein n=1 Tax=Phialemonium atrogriseum TaxID=1093897 RepID=A0AAJ0C9E0_9PEZI|nr:uncharacterized protein QBC33DRAFT_575004 [Phialemonium atrogriseum]KAK1772396.1 hypothetical protein QBC33DRAFT_575004 [Phialemonium atrogriseum]
MSYTREQAVAKPPARPVKPKIRPTAMTPQGHFDPDELSRRLYLVMADQRAHSERKRRARAEAAKSKEAEAEAEASTSASAPPRDGETAPAAGQSKDPSAAPHRSRSADISTDLISELRKQKSTHSNTQRKPSKLAMAPPASTTSSEPSQYHHVPREAAKQFARTTTVGGMRESGLIHKLSETALKFHLGGLHSNRNVEGDASLGPFQLTRSLQRGQSQRERIYDRNQFQRTRILETAAEMDEERERDTELQQRHTFQGELARTKPPEQNQQPNPRRNSTGDVLGKLEDRGGSSAPMEPVADIMDDTIPQEEPEQTPLALKPRVDWTQSDEVAQRHKGLRSPLLRKADSIWTLKGRLGSRGSSQEKADPPHIPEAPKSPKPGFFAKFKR